MTKPNIASKHRYILTLDTNKTIVLYCTEEEAIVELQYYVYDMGYLDAYLLLDEDEEVATAQPFEEE